jgi:hypothetical protein
MSRECSALDPCAPHFGEPWIRYAFSYPLFPLNFQPGGWRSPASLKMGMRKRKKIVSSSIAALRHRLFAVPAQIAALSILLPRNMWFIIFDVTGLFGQRWSCRSPVALLGPQHAPTSPMTKTAHHSHFRYVSLCDRGISCCTMHSGRLKPNLPPLPNFCVPKFLPEYVTNSL